MANLTYISIIGKHKDKFMSGKRFTRRQLCKLFRVKDIVHEGQFADVQRSNLRLVGVQAEINDILSDSGLCLRSENYYSRFYIADKKQTAAVILNQQEKAEAHKACSDRLEKRMAARIKAGTWGTYDPATVTRLIGQAAIKKSGTYKRKAKRVKRW